MTSTAINPNLFTYRAGRFESTDSLALDADEGVCLSLADQLTQRGYVEVECVGNPFSTHFALYEHHVEVRWAVVFKVGERWCCVVIETWPDLIGLLKDLSPVVLAGLISNTDCRGQECPAHLPIQAVEPYPARKPAPQKERCP
jgi:hypothetical protein